MKCLFLTIIVLECLLAQKMPYGEPKFLKQLEDILKITDDGFFNLNEKYFLHFKDGIAMDWEGGKPSIASLFTNKLVFGD